MSMGYANTWGYDTGTKYIQEHFRKFTKMGVHHIADVNNMFMSEREIRTSRK